MNAEEFLEAFASHIADIVVERLKEEDTRLVTAEEAARMLGVSKTTLWRWDNDGTLKSIRIGRKNYYRLSDIGKAEHETP